MNLNYLKKIWNQKDNKNASDGGKNERIKYF